MKKTILALAAFAVVGCKTGTTLPVLQSVITGAQGAICPLAQELADQGGSSLAKLTGASNPLACGSDLYQPLVNSNICAQPLPANAGPQLKALMAAHPDWKTIGDIPAAAIHGGLKAELVKPDGVIVGGILCPLGIGVGMGVFSSSIPKDCQGPNNLSASAADQALVTACQAITAALP